MLDESLNHLDRFQDVAKLCRRVVRASSSTNHSRTSAGWPSSSSFTTSDHPALGLSPLAFLESLARNVLNAAHGKCSAVNQMRNTILYAERIMMELEAKAQHLLRFPGTNRSPIHSPDIPEEFYQPRSAPQKASQNLLNAPSVPRQRTPLQLSRLLLNQVDNRRGSSHLIQDSSLMAAPTPISPRIPSAIPGKSKSAASIKDFDMLKPISKGAFGQIMNVKSEQKILMNQSDSDFVVNLFNTFSSRDHLYLVMEYLNCGNCAALVKALGNLPEEWTRNYIAEVVMGLEYLHSTGVVHRAKASDAGHKHFVGTPHYLAPKSIIGMDDDISPEAIDFMDKLMCADPMKLLGANGAAEVKTHPFLAGINWENLFKSKASFVPSVTDPESTDYFDPRCATQVFHDDDNPPPLPNTATTTTTVSELANEGAKCKLRGGQNHKRLRFPQHMSLSRKLIGSTVPTDSSNSWSALSSSRPHQMLNHVHGRRPSKQFSRTFGQNTLDDPTPRNSMPSRTGKVTELVLDEAVFSISELEKLLKVEFKTVAPNALADQQKITNRTAAAMSSLRVIQPHILAVLTARKKVENEMNKMLMEGLVLLD
ncbi:kinase-like domain-containing protein [Phakopsora pachyrhizi]|uniref:non-specific serine/threonine protein kinase n=1 Tax=Phakopsora pachyrhizi TaxID=170000 RepID=A0AAV0BRC0_PHAPC|nr:kinase-like domain-containing protein [Phakopsora pachyrhizi]